MKSFLYHFYKIEQQIVCFLWFQASLEFASHNPIKVHLFVCGLSSITFEVGGKGETQHYTRALSPISVCHGSLLPAECRGGLTKQSSLVLCVRGWVGDEFRIEGFPAVGVDRGNTAALLLLTILLLTIFSKPGIFKKMKTVKSKVSVNIGSIQVRRCSVDRLIKKVLRKIQNKADFMGILLQQLSKVHMPKTFYGVKVVIINVFFVCVFIQVRQPVFLLCNRRAGQRADHAWSHPPLRRASG